MASQDPNFVYGPKVPHVQLLPGGGLTPGSALTLKGMVKSGFSVNLCCGLLVEGDHRDNVALHFNPRLKERKPYVVLNSFINGAWGQTEQRPTDCPFKRGAPFTIRILALSGEYKIAVNGAHFTDYPHRLAVSDVKVLYVAGEISLDLVQFEPAMSGSAAPGFIQAPASAPGFIQASAPPSAANPPLYKPPVPFHHIITLRPGSQLYLTGTPKQHSRGFTINLRLGSHQGGDIALHFNVRIDESVVVRNSFRGGAWETEERSGPSFPFRKGGTFDLILLTDYDGFKVAVNGQHFIAFAHRMPFQAVTNLEIDGNLTLAQVHMP